MNFWNITLSLLNYKYFWFFNIYLNIYYYVQTQWHILQKLEQLKIWNGWSMVYAFSLEVLESWILPSFMISFFLIRTLHPRKSAGPSNANFSFLPIGKRREREMLLSAIARWLKYSLLCLRMWLCLRRRRRASPLVFLDSWNYFIWHESMHALLKQTRSRPPIK